MTVTKGQGAVYSGRRHLRMWEARKAIDLGHRGCRDWALGDGDSRDWRPRGEGCGDVGLTGGDLFGSGRR